MTVSVTKTNLDDSKLGPDKQILPDLAGSLTIISGDTESKPIKVKGLHAVGLIVPSTITGLTGVEFHVSSLEGGVYGKLVEDPGALADNLAYGTSFIAEWNYLKFVYVGAVTGSGEIPLSFG